MIIVEAHGVARSSVEAGGLRGRRRGGGEFVGEQGQFAGDAWRSGRARVTMISAGASRTSTPMRTVKGRL